MKKKFIIIAFIAAALPVSAQLTVEENGNVILADETTERVKLHVGGQSSINLPGNIGTRSVIYSLEPGTNTALLGEAVSPTTVSGIKNIGVCGLAGNAQSGYNYGTAGVMTSFTNGTGIYGSVCTSYVGNPYPNIDGIYAGYFYGTTKVVGNIIASNILNMSDINLKENITPIFEEEGQSALQSIMDMNVVKYNLKQDVYEEIEKIENEEYAAYIKDQRERKHFGVIAQELNTIYPNLVVKGQDGYLSVNYIELVPVLIQAIKDLKKELDEAKGVGEEQTPRHLLADIGTANDDGGTKLFNNTPNPFNEKTKIRFQLGTDVKSASICIFDMQGKMLKEYELGTNDTQLSISASEFHEGMYLYSLIANGQEIDTKRMILTK